MCVGGKGLAIHLSQVSWSELRWELVIYLLKGGGGHVYGGNFMCNFFFTSEFLPFALSYALSYMTISSELTFVHLSITAVLMTTWWQILIQSNAAWNKTILGQLKTSNQSSGLDISLVNFSINLN